jgi:hypothetical protein
MIRPVIFCAFANVVADSIVSRSKYRLYCFILFIVHQFCLAKLRKTAQKTLGKARKSGAEVNVLTQVKSFC